MRSHLKILLVVGLLALMMPFLLGYLAGPGVAAHPNTIGDHANSKNITNETCNGCHDRMVTNEGNGTYAGAHRRHFVSAFLNFIGTDPSADKGCGKCHEETVYGGNSYLERESFAGLGSGYEGDLSYADTDTPNGGNFVRAARKQVKPDVCESCHGKFNTAGSHGGLNLVQTDPRGCERSVCHTAGDVVTSHAAATYINSRYANSSVYCGRCHGELQWYQTAETSNLLP